MNLTQRKLIALLTPVVLILLAIAMTHNSRDDRTFYFALFWASLISLCVESWLWGWETDLQEMRKILIPGVAVGGFLITAAIISRPHFESVHRHSSMFNIVGWFRDDCEIDERKWGAIPIICTKEGIVRDTAREKKGEEDYRKGQERSELDRKRQEVFGLAFKFDSFLDNSQKSKNEEKQRKLKQEKLDKEIEELQKKLVEEVMKAHKERRGGGAFDYGYEQFSPSLPGVPMDHPPEGTTIKLRDNPFSQDTVRYWLISILFLGFIEYRLFQGKKPEALN